MTSKYSTQNELLLNKLLKFYNKDNNLQKILNIINGEGKISLRLIDWFTTNYAKKNFIVYQIKGSNSRRFKVYVDYKLKLKAYSKRRFDPFCRWERINIPYNKDCHVQTTIGQLNFFKWALENKILDYFVDTEIKNKCQVKKKFIKESNILERTELMTLSKMWL